MVQVAKRKTITLDEELSTGIMDYASTHNITPYILLLTSLGIYTRCKKDHEKEFIASACLNRLGPREKNMVGLFYKNSLGAGRDSGACMREGRTPRQRLAAEASVPPAILLPS